MANFAKIILVGVSLSNAQVLLPNSEMLESNGNVIINPQATGTTVELGTDWNDTLVSALAHMTDEEFGVEGEYFTKIGNDTANFIAQRIYKAVKPINESHSLVGEDGKNRRPIGSDTGEVYFRKSTVSELLKNLGNPAPQADSFTVGGDSRLLYALAQVAGVKTTTDTFTLLTTSSKGLVSTDVQQENHMVLPQDWDRALEAVKTAKTASLPTINGFDGVVEGDFVVYSCAKLPVSWFKPVEGATRRIKTLELSSEVTINADEFQQIVDFLNS